MDVRFDGYPPDLGTQSPIFRNIYPAGPVELMHCSSPSFQSRFGVELMNELAM